MTTSTKLKTAATAFFTAFQNEARLDAEANTTTQERVSILEDLAIQVAKEHDVAPKKLIDAISKPVLTLQDMIGKTKLTAEPTCTDAVVRLGRPLPDKGFMLEFVTLFQTDHTVALSTDFVYCARHDLPKAAGAFHQSGVTIDNRPSEYHAFEMWTFDKCAKEVHDIAKEFTEVELGLKFEVSEEALAVINA